LLNGREYLSVKLDDPSFPEPVYAALAEDDEGAKLVWTIAKGLILPYDTR
jgi:uncharacterized protein (DUF736 family)